MLRKCGCAVRALWGASVSGMVNRVKGRVFGGRAAG